MIKIMPPVNIINPRSAFKENFSFRISGFYFDISRIILIFAVGIESHYCEDFHIFDG